MQPRNTNYFDVKVFVRPVDSGGMRAGNAARNRPRTRTERSPAFSSVARHRHVDWIHRANHAQQCDCSRSRTLARTLPRGPRIPSLPSAVPPQRVVSEMPSGLFRCPPHRLGVAGLERLLLSDAVNSATAGKQWTGIDLFDDAAGIDLAKDVARDFIVGIVESAQNHRTVADVVIDV